MAASLDGFIPRHSYLICFDSDGTVMDTMAVKHSRCLCPALIEVWGLNAWEQPVAKLWHDVNLYQITRGVNRFKALALVLRAVNDQYTPINGLSDLEAWVSSGTTLSGDALGPMARSSDSEMLKKTFRWTETVNQKAFCIAELLKKGYANDNVLMTGDAPGDLDAAKSNGVFYYPILVRHEAESWTEFRETAVDRLTSGNYSGIYQNGKISAFLDNLK